MAQEKSNNTRGESVLLNVEKISQSIGQDDVQTLVSVIDTEIGNRKLEKEEIEQLQEIMSVDALESAKWKSVADVLKYISVFALAESHPEQMKKITETLLGIVGIFYPIANTAQGVLAKVPDRVFSSLIKIGGLASPEYLIYQGINMVAKKKLEKAKAQANCNVGADDTMTTLIIVCKNKLLSSEMSRLINSEDDLDEETVIGTKDGTVHTIVWNESAWEAFRDKLSGSEKILIIGKVKNAVPLSAEQVRFEKFGVKYGWDNNIATIEATPSVLKKASNYKEFLSAMSALPLSERLKKNAKFKFDWVTAGKLAFFPPLLLADLLREDTEVRKQQLLFGLYTLYMQDLSTFLD